MPSPHLYGTLCRVGGSRSELKAAESSPHQATLTDLPEATVLAVPQPTATEPSQPQMRPSPQRQIGQQQTIQSLRAQGLSQIAIAQKLGISPRTAERYSSLPDLPEPCGFEGSLRTLERYLSGLRKAQGLPPVRGNV